VPFDAILLVPDFAAANGPELQRVQRFSTGNSPELQQLTRLLGAPTRDQDMFQFSNLTPGGYTIYPFPKFEDVEFRNPAFGGEPGALRFSPHHKRIGEPHL
jgi:hypothetical protein